MNQRYALLAEGAKLKIYKLPVNQTARLINEHASRKVLVFETLNDAREAALALVERAKANTKPGVAVFSTRPQLDYQEQLKALSELTENRAERYCF